MTIIFCHISISKISSPAHLVITPVPVLAVEVFSSLYTILKCSYLYVFPFTHLILQCYATPLMVSGNLLSSLMTSQLENCLFSFFEMQYLAGVSRMGLLEAAGVSPPISGHDLCVGIAGLAGEQLILKKDFIQKSLNGIICWKSCAFPKPFERENPESKYIKITWRHNFSKQMSS